MANPFLLQELLTEVDRTGMAPGVEQADQLDGADPRRCFGSCRPPWPLACRRNANGSRHRCPRQGSHPASARLARLDPESAEEAASALVRANFLASGEPLRYVHPLIRSTVLAEHSPLALGHAHLDAARILRDEQAPVDAIGGHLMVSPVTGNSWVVEILASAAGRALDLAAPGVAARLLTRAIDEPQPAATRIGLLEELARAEAEFGLPALPNISSRHSP